MEWLLYISILIIALAFAMLVIYFVATLKALRKTMDNVTTTVEELQEQVNGITNESTNLLHKTNALADDIQHKSDTLNSIFLAAQDLGVTFQNMNTSVKRVSDTVSKQADERSEQAAKAVQWGNVALELWTRWKKKKAEQERKETAGSGTQ
ncbi:DUF948 domain-containing protein [Alkalicoccus chagannorensis]|uniref:DUF948 domain-containing protein n=1 Tax=Alkalicoccus chagannorensis TaxID=427072 RepID=UPI000401BBEE|nr:DUF948 domain-containing protein [Alkalicoccus chagannorensis]